MSLGRLLGLVETIKMKTACLFKGIIEDEPERCIQQWMKRWQKCILISIP